MTVPRRTTALAAVTAGALIFAGQVGEIAFGSPSGLVDVLYVLAFAGGVVALGIALWGLRGLAAPTRYVQAGFWIALAGLALLGLFMIQALVEVARTGEVPENFALFGLGFLLAIVGHLLFARGLRSRLGRGWLFPLVAAAGAVAAIVIPVDPYHDIGLVMFEAAWVGLGLTLLRLERPGQRPRS